MKSYQSHLKKDCLKEHERGAIPIVLVASWTSQVPFNLEQCTVGKNYSTCTVTEK